MERIGNIGLITLSLSADYGGHGNSFHGSGGRGNKRAQMRYCLRLLRSMVSVGDEVLNQDLVDQGAINQIVGECGLRDITTEATQPMLYPHNTKNAHHQLIYYTCSRHTSKCKHKYR